MTAVPTTESAPTLPGERPQTAAPRWITHVPIALFAAVMGIGGLGLAWRRAAAILGTPAMVGEGLIALAALVFVAVAGLYAGKAVLYPGAVRADFTHPVRNCFFATASIALLILAAGALPHSHALAEAVWWAGTVLHLSLALAILNRWILHRCEIAHAGPSWFLPAVGSLLVPQAGAALGYPELSWLFFGVGVAFWIVLFPLIFNRIVCHGPLAPRLQPTLAILIAPPALVVLALVSLTGGLETGLERGLVGLALFLALLMLSLARMFLAVPFFVSWWAMTFPAAAVTSIALLYHAAVGTTATLILGAGCLAFATGLIGLVAARTLQALVAGRLFLPE